MSLIELATAGLVWMSAQCFLWWAAVRSHRQQGSRKWAIVRALEEKMPARPFSAEHGKGYGSSVGASRYLALTRIEMALPIVMAFGYFSAYLLIIAE